MAITEPISRKVHHSNEEPSDITWSISPDLAARQAEKEGISILGSMMDAEVAATYGSPSVLNAVVVGPCPAVPEDLGQLHFAEAAMTPLGNRDPDEFRRFSWLAEPVIPARDSIGAEFFFFFLASQQGPGLPVVEYCNLERTT
jgi:hypothetical protein